MTHRGRPIRISHVAGLNGRDRGRLRTRSFAAPAATRRSDPARQEHRRPAQHPRGIDTRRPPTVQAGLPAMAAGTRPCGRRHRPTGRQRAALPVDRHRRRRPTALTTHHPVPDAHRVDAAFGVGVLPSIFLPKMGARPGAIGWRAAATGPSTRNNPAAARTGPPIVRFAADILTETLGESVNRTVASQVDPSRYDR
jgi:hypothetical protein